MSSGRGPSSIEHLQSVDIVARNRLETYRFDEDGNRFERPLLVSFTSESDTATRLFLPAVFLQSDLLENPTALAVALDRTLWLGDRQGQKLHVIAADGSVETTIRSLSGSWKRQLHR